MMKSKFIAGLAVFVLAVSGALSISAFAQTTEETPAPTDQPSAPMEIGQPGQGPMAPNQAPQVDAAGWATGKSWRCAAY